MRLTLAPLVASIITFWLYIEYIIMIYHRFWMHVASTWLARWMRNEGWLLLLLLFVIDSSSDGDDVVQELLHEPSCPQCKKKWKKNLSIQMTGAFDVMNLMKGDWWR